MQPWWTVLGKKIPAEVKTTPPGFSIQKAIYRQMFEWESKLWPIWAERLSTSRLFGVI